MEDENESMAAFAAHALQKQEAGERISQQEEHPYEQVLSPEQVFGKFSELFAFLGEDVEGNPNVLEEYQQITDKKEQLRFILSSSLSDKVRLFCSESFSYSNYDNFMQRLQFQQDFINGTAKVRNNINSATGSLK